MRLAVVTLAEGLDVYQLRREPEMTGEMLVSVCTQAFVDAHFLHRTRGVSSFNDCDHAECVERRIVLEELADHDDCSGVLVRTRLLAADTLAKFRLDNEALTAHVAALEEQVEAWQERFTRLSAVCLDDQKAAQTLVGRLENIVEAARELAGAAHHKFPGDVYKGKYVRFTDRWEPAREALDRALSDLDATR